VGRLEGGLGALAERPFRLLWLGQSISSAGDVLVPVALAFAVLESGGSPLELGLVLGLLGLARVLLTPVGGVWGDRVSRQLVMLVSDLVRAAAWTVLAVLLIAGEAAIWQLAAGAIVYGAASAFFAPSSTALVPQTVSADRLQAANALMLLTRNALFMVGPLVSGLLVASVGPGWVFAIDAVTFAVSAGFLLALRRVLPRQEAQPPRPFLTDLAGGWRELRARRWLWASIVYFCLFNFAFSAYLVLGPVVAHEELGGAEAWGGILAGAGAGAFVGSLVALRYRPARPLFVGYAITYAVAVPPLFLIRPLPVLAIAAAAAGAGLSIALFNAFWTTTLQEGVPREALSRVAAYDWLSTWLLTTLGFGLAGPAAHLFGRGPTLVGVAAILALANTAMLLLPDVRNLVRGGAPAPALARGADVAGHAARSRADVASRL
jgi:MFS family permease